MREFKDQNKAEPGWAIMAASIKNKPLLKRPILTFCIGPLGKVAEEFNNRGVRNKNPKIE